MPSHSLGWYEPAKQIIIVIDCNLISLYLLDFIGEPLFVPRPGAVDEDDGVVLSVHNSVTDGGTQLCINDARDLKLVARLQSPVSLPYGFHGCWLASDPLRTPT